MVVVKNAAILLIDNEKRLGAAGLGADKNSFATASGGESDIPLEPTRHPVATPPRAWRNLAPFGFGAGRLAAKIFLCFPELHGNIGHLLESQRHVFFFNVVQFREDHLICKHS